MEINFYITEGIILSKHVNSTVQLVLNEVLVEENQIDYIPMTMIGKAHIF